jgi:hypothetical protein
VTASFYFITYVLASNAVLLSVFLGIISISLDTTIGHQQYTHYQHQILHFYFKLFPGNRAKIRAIFDSFEALDVDADGHVTASELSFAYSVVTGHKLDNIAMSKVMHWMHEIGSGGDINDGNIGLSEFMQFMILNHIQHGNFYVRRIAPPANGGLKREGTLRNIFKRRSSSRRTTRDDGAELDELDEEDEGNAEQCIDTLPERVSVDEPLGTPLADNSAPLADKSTRTFSSDIGLADKSPLGLSAIENAMEFIPKATIKGVVTYFDSADDTVDISFRLHDRVKITKPGTYCGRCAKVRDLEWSPGRVTVDLDGATKSYLPSEIVLVERNVAPLNSPLGSPLNSPLDSPLNSLLPSARAEPVATTPSTVDPLNSTSRHMAAQGSSWSKPSRPVAGRIFSSDIGFVDDMSWQTTAQRVSSRPPLPTTTPATSAGRTFSSDIGLVDQPWTSEAGASFEGYRRNPLDVSVVRITPDRKHHVTSF